MKKISSILVFTFVFLAFSCGEDSDFTASEDYSLSDSYRSSSDESPTGGQGGQAGLVTAGEWNDLNNWDFWNNLLNGQEYSKNPGYWGFYTNNRISVQLENSGIPVVNVKVAVKKNQDVIWEAKTDNLGAAELWIGLFEKENSIDIADYKLFIKVIKTVQI